MDAIFNKRLPYQIGLPNLPGVRPLQMGDWLIEDDVFADQMRLRTTLLQERRQAVLALTPKGQTAASELLDFVLDWLKAHNPRYQFHGTDVTRPDGVTVHVDPKDPMGSLGQLVQEDLCIMDKHGDQHVLVAAVLCFPANWRLADKIDKPLTTIHDPVPEYDDTIARKVQRLFDGVQVGQPMWRYNALYYAKPELHQPLKFDGHMYGLEAAAALPYFRSERQSILRLPKTRACVFSIHTFVLRQADIDLPVMPRKIE